MRCKADIEPDRHGGLILDGAGAARDQAPRLDRACQTNFQGSELN